MVPAAAGGPRAKGHRPVASVGWQVPEVESGWLLFNATLAHPRLDAHCKWHRGCKVDRVLSNSSIDLHVVWLSCGEGVGKTQHEQMKAEFSGEGGLDTRTGHHTFFMDMATIDAEGVAAQVLEAEELGFGHNDEPR